MCHNANSTNCTQSNYRDNALTLIYEGSRLLWLGDFTQAHLEGVEGGLFVEKTILYSVRKGIGLLERELRIMKKQTHLEESGLHKRK
jgi:hypothetical protein